MWRLITVLLYIFHPLCADEDVMCLEELFGDYGDIM